METKALSNKRIYPADAPPVFARWQPLILDDSMPVAPIEVAPPPEPEPLLDYLNNQAPEAQEPETPTTAELLSCEAVENIREQARAEGFEQGLSEGRANAAAQLQALQQLIKQLDVTAQQLESELAPQVLDLALDLARHVIRSELTLKPEHLIGLVKDLVKTLPLPTHHPKLHVHPDDVALIHDYLGADLEPLGFKVIPDPHLTRGDCVIETNQSQLDATLKTRWQQLTKSLGRKTPLTDEPA